MAELDLILKEMECRLGIEPPSFAPNKPEILVVDDDGDLRNSLCDVLNSRYSVISCETGDLALKHCSPSIEVVLLDIKMPGKNGLTVFREIKDLRPEVPIVFFTAHPGHHEAFLESKRLDAIAILKKGCGVTQLIDAIEKALKPEKAN